MRRVLVLAALLVALPGGAVDIEHVPVRDAGNPADEASNCIDDSPECGSVPYDYAIGRYEVTNEAYAEFLNAVALPDDPNGLYNAGMASTGIVPVGLFPIGLIGYSVVAGLDRHPVVYVSFWDTLRFANWLHNGQPQGAQDVTTTEDGAYTITAAGVADNTITRNAGALVFVPSENEWHKAAYYDQALDAGTGGYFDYPTGTNVPPTCTAPTILPNSANCYFSASATPVGSYPNTPSPYGTFDQGGNAREWNETIFSFGQRGSRGGAFAFGGGTGEDPLAASSGRRARESGLW